MVLKFFDDFKSLLEYRLTIQGTKVQYKKILYITKNSDISITKNGDISITKNSDISITKNSDIRSLK